MVSKTLLVCLALVAVVAADQSPLPQCPPGDNGGNSSYLPNPDDCQ